MMKERMSPKIELYMTRSFSEKLNATFEFCIENWKVLLKWNIYLVLPLCLIAGFFFNGYFNGLVDLLALREGEKTALLVHTAFSFILNAGGWILSVILLSLVSVGLLYALLRLYDEREERLDNLTFEELTPVLLRNMGRLFVLSLLLTLLLAVLYSALIAIIIGVFALHKGLGVLLILLVIMGSFVLFIALALTGPACLLDDESVMQSILNGLRLGLKTFGGVFSVGFICTLISWTISSISMIPYYTTMFSSMLKVRDNGVDAIAPSGMDVLWSALLIVFMLFVNYIAHILPMLGMGYQYGHAAEKYDARHTERVIEDYEEL